MKITISRRYDIKKCLLLIFMICISSLHAKGMSIYNKDALIERNGIFFETMTNKKANGYYYWDDKEPKVMFTIVNGKFEGLSLGYHKNKLMNIEYNSNDKMQQDIIFYPNGTIKKIMYMVNGKLDEKDFLKNGNISYTLKQIDKYTAVVVNYDSNSVKKLEVIVKTINNKVQIKQCYSLDSYGGRDKIPLDRCQLMIKDLKKQKYHNTKSKP